MTTTTVRRWRPSRTSSLVGLAVVLLFALLALVSTGQSEATSRPLDPESTGPVGSRAVAEVLRQHEVDVVVARTIDELEAALAHPAGTTVALGDGSTIGPDHGARLLDAATRADRLVLLDTSPGVVDALALPLTSEPATITARRPAECATAYTSDLVRPTEAIVHASYALRAADPPVDARVVARPTFCFPLGAGASALAVIAGSATNPRIVALGASEAATNRRADDADHAALVLRALGASPRLVWFEPSTADVDTTLDAGRGVPAAALPLVALLLGCVVLLALVRGRRLGRLVPEPLPVVVRASETTASRADLYRRAQDRGRAATVLRQATRERVERRLSVPAGTSLDVLAAVVADRADLPADRVHDLLGGPAPDNDRALVTLSTDLADLEQRVRQP